MITNDILWKGIIEGMAPYFLEFFFPDEDFDLSKGIEFKDKELNEIFPSEEGIGSRRVDKLMGVYSTTGLEKWILLHVEVQGYRGDNLPKRRFQYYYRIIDRFDKPVTALVILTDNQKNYNPSVYTSSLMGTSIRYQYNTYKILDKKEKELLKIDNPFAIVILTVLAALKIGKESELEQVKIKVRLTKNLLAKKYPKETIRDMLNFIKYYVRFKHNRLNLLYEQEVIKMLPNTNTMGLEELIIHIYKEEGRKEGREEGRQEVMELAEKKEIETKINAARNMLREGLDVSFICRMLEIPEEFVLAIKNENRNND